MCEEQKNKSPKLLSDFGGRLRIRTSRLCPYILTHSILYITFSYLNSIHIRRRKNPQEHLSIPYKSSTNTVLSFHI